MAHLLKQKTTYFVDPNGNRVPKDTPGAVKRVTESEKWYAANVPGFPKGRRIPLATHRRVAERMLADLIDKGERGIAGMAVRDDGKELLSPLVTEFGEGLGRKSDAKHVKFVLLCIRRIFERAKVGTIADLRTSDVSTKVEAVVWDLMKGEEAVSAPTAARAGKHARQFTRWLWRKKKAIDHDPLAGLDLPSQAGQGRRRAFLPGELAALDDATRVSERVFRGLTGQERALLYLVAAGTGLRAGELAALTTDFIDLEGDEPVIALPGCYTKNKKDANLPIPKALLKRLRAHVASLALGEKLWGGSWWERAADMLRDDLAEASIPAVVNGKEAVFHSFRHTHSTLLGKSAPVKVAQELARHSTPLLTIGRYGHIDMQEMTEAIDRLPLPGSAHTSPFASLSRSDLKEFAEGLTSLFAAVWNTVLFTPRLTPKMDPTGDVLRLPETTRLGSDPQPSRRRA